MSELKIAGIAINQTPLDFKGNTQRILNSIQEAKNQGYNLLCFPELCISGYGCEDMFFADWVLENSLNALNVIKKHSQDIAIIVGLPFKYENKIYNTACFIENGDIKGFYAKQHLANEGIHYEKRWFSEWKPNTIVDIPTLKVPLGQVSFVYKNKKIAFEVCEDAWVNNRPAENYTNTDLIVNLSASHFSFGKHNIRQKIVVSSSEKYNCTYLYVNLLGNESGRAIYDGDVFIAEKGKLLAKNKRFSFKDFEILGIKHGITEAYNSKEEEFLQAETLALLDYWRKSKANGFMLSLSGGADSSTCAILIAEMWKKAKTELSSEELLAKLPHLTENTDFKSVLTCAYQGTKNSSYNTYNSAQKLADDINASFFRWDIDDEVDSYTKKIEQVLHDQLDWNRHDIALQNIQARTRSPIIWFLANIKNALLIATSNRSESSVGYATMDGDTSGSISPLSGIDKTFIVEWLKWAEQTLGYESLKYVNSLSPSAELRPQTSIQEDEKDLMPYPILNRIEQLLVYEKKSVEQVKLIIQQEFKTEKANEYVQKFTTLFRINQWKRERYAPSFHLDDYSLDPKTWCRFPILSGGFS